MYRVLRITVLIWLTMIYQESRAVLECRVRDSSKKVDCAAVGLQIQDIGPGRWLPEKVKSLTVIEFLDISGNRYRTADCNDLTRLIQFNAKRLVFDGKTNGMNNFKTCLTKLKALEELDLTSTEGMGPNLTGITWPKKLTKLTFVKMQLSGIVGLDKLDQLQELDMSTNHLFTFPKLHRTAPILLLHLRGNNIANISVEAIAPYCEMSSFSVPESVNDVANYRTCAPLQEWAKKYGIDTFETLSCKLPSSGNQIKNFVFSEEAMKARSDCLNALPGTGIWDILFFAVFFSILFPLLYYANEAYNNYQAKKLETPVKPVKHRRRRTTTVAPVGSDYEGGQVEVDGEREES